MGVKVGRRFTLRGVKCAENAEFRLVRAGIVVS